MLSDALGASLLGNMLVGRAVRRASKRTNRGEQDF